MAQNEEYPKSKAEHGFLLLEVLVVIVLFAVLGVIAVQGAVFAQRSRHLALSQSTAAQIALEELEKLAGLDPINFTDASDYTQEVTRSLMRFTRVVDFTVSADGTRNVVVKVDGTSAEIPVHVEAQDSFALWGTN